MYIVVRCRVCIFLLVKKNCDDVCKSRTAERVASCPFSHCFHVTTATTVRTAHASKSRMTVLFMACRAKKTVVHLNTCAIRPYCVRIVSRFSSILRRYDRDPFFYARTYAVVSKFLYIIFL